MNTNNPGPVDALVELRRAANYITDARQEPEEELWAAVAAVAELVRRSLEMLEQDQCRFATYNAAPHMSTAVDNLRAALAKFGGAK